MDPYLEHPTLWPDGHNRLIAAIADHLSPRLAPKYYVRLERRTYLLSPDDLAFVSRATTRPRAHLYPFNLRDPIPTFPLPLLPGDEEPPVDLGAIFHALYERARYDLSLDYTQPPVPPVRDEDATWAWERVERQE